MVPKGRRAALLKLAHSSMLGMHVSHSKTIPLLNRKFIYGLECTVMLTSCVSNVRPAKATLKIDG